MNKVLYTLQWSTVLFFATFLKLCKGEDIFSFTDFEQACSNYFFPLTMAVELFLIDFCYDAYKYPYKTNFVFLGVVLFVLSLGITFAFVTCKVIAVVCFILSWISLTYMKWASLNEVNNNSTEDIEECNGMLIKQ